MQAHTIALFGEAEKGEFHVPQICQTVPQLLDCFGEPPTESLGIHCAIQALMYDYTLLFLRVREEGFSHDDYLYGLDILQKDNFLADISAVCMPGVGDNEIIEAITPVCAIYHSLLIISQADLYDYLTSNVTTHDG